MGWIDFGVFAGRVDTVVAGSAVVDDTGVIEDRWCKGAAGDMTHTTILLGDHVIRFCVFAGGVDTVVAGVATGSGYLRARVVHERICEVCRVVADGTVAAGVLVNGTVRFAARAEGYEGGAAVVAGRAVPGDANVVKGGGAEPGHGMTQVTVLSCGQMIGRFDQIRRYKTADMTTLTTAIDIRVHSAQKNVRSKHVRGVVAGAAFILSRNMVGDLRCCDPRGVAGRTVVRINAEVVESDSGEACEVAGVMAGRTVQRCG